MSEISAERVRATCGVCRKSDSHPKHHTEGDIHHLDCGRSIDCITCDSILRASGELHGEQLTQFMSYRAEESAGV